MKDQCNAVLDEKSNDQKESFRSEFEVFNPGDFLAPAGMQSVEARGTQNRRRPKLADSSASASDFVIRDTFSIPPDEYGKIESIRMRLAREGLIYSKSEVVRAGLLALEALQDNEMIARLSTVKRVRPGRKI